MSYYSIEIPQEPENSYSPIVHMRGLSESIPMAINPRIIDSRSDELGNLSPSYEQVMQMISQTIAQMKIYVVESEITETQNAIKTVIEQASF